MKLFTSSLFRAFVIYLCLMVMPAQAQNMSVEDLKAALEKEQHDTIRIKLLASLAELAGDEEWPAFNAKARSLAEEKLRNMEPGNPQYGFYMRCLGNALNNEGYLSMQNGRPTDALASHRKALVVREAINDKEGIANSLNNIGAIYDVQGNVPKALDFYYRGLKIREEMGVKESIAVSLNNIGMVYHDQGDLNKSLEYFQRSLKIQEETGDKEHTAISLNNIGGIYSARGDYAKALQYYNKSIKIREEIGDIKGIGYSLVNIGIIYISAGDPLVTSSVEDSRKEGMKKALQNFERARRIAEENNDKMGVVSANSNTGYLYLEQKNYPKAIEYSKKALVMAQEAKYPIYIRHSYLNLYKATKAMGNTNEALGYYEKYIVQRDTLNNQSNRKAMFKSQLKYEFEKKAAADSVKVAEEKKVTYAQLKAEKTLRFALYAGLFLVAVFALFMVNRFRVISRQKNFIEQKEKETAIQKKIIEKKQTEIIDSITYARRIQQSLLTTEAYIHRNINRLLQR